MHAFLQDARIRKLSDDFSRVGIFQAPTGKSLKFQFDLPGGEQVTVGYIDYHLKLWTDTTCRPPYEVCHMYLVELAKALDLEVRKAKQNPNIWTLCRDGGIPSIEPLWPKLHLWPPIARKFSEQMFQAYVPPLR